MYGTAVSAHVAAWAQRPPPPGRYTSYRTPQGVITTESLLLHVIKANSGHWVSQSQPSSCCGDGARHCWLPPPPLPAHRGSARPSGQSHTRHRPLLPPTMKCPGLDWLYLRARGSGGKVILLPHTRNPTRGILRNYPLTIPDLTLSGFRGKRGLPGTMLVR